MTRSNDSADAGKMVVTPQGIPIGVVERVHAGDIYVRPIPGLLKGFGSWLTGHWNDDQFPLNEKMIDRITDDKIILDSECVDLTTPTNRP